ncbi:MAG: HAMP domain-containing histidine kinase [Cellulosilyticum sp.]|nr:HAMP domain-containing histidine kinase [Cellulosilyticum sp.]
MKGSLKIIRHYLFLTTIVALLLLIINFIVAMSWTYSGMKYSTSNYNIEKISNGLTLQSDTFSLSPEASEILHSQCSWAMLLDDTGNVIWQFNLPNDIPHSYTASQIAGFSKWYLKDYPVRVWSHPNGLLVVANPQNSLWKLQLEAPENMLYAAPYWLLVLIISNILGAILLSLLLGLRFFKSLKEIVLGIEDLAQKKPVCLHTKGILKNLASNINATSNELIHQQKLIEKRDTARNNWITGVSHDIRTPLSMIMGYSSNLENNPHFSEEDRKQFTIIRMQSERIKNLVDDLNLTTKLEYDMQPLNKEPFYLSTLLRKVVVDYLNTLYQDKYTLELNISDDAQGFMIHGDCRLFERALCNMIHNCMQHNPEGCNIFITFEQREKHYVLEVKDIGIGFTPAILEKLNHTSQLPTGVTHGLGLFIVKQIAQVSGATIHYDNWSKGSCITLTF